MAEWSKAHAWKVCRRGTVSRVRIPHCPPLAPAKAFSRSGCGRIFPLFSRVMRVGLSTGLCARWPGSVLSGPIFSGPNDCADLVKFCKILTGIDYFLTRMSTSTRGAFAGWNRGRTFAGGGSVRARCSTSEQSDCHSAASVCGTPSHQSDPASRPRGKGGRPSSSRYALCVFAADWIFF